MRTTLLVVALVVSGACSPMPTADAGVTGGGAAVGGGTVAGGGSASAGGAAAAGGTAAGGSAGGGSAAAGGAATPLPDGGAGTLVGPTSFNVVAARSLVGTGAQSNLFLTALYNATPVSCQTSPNPPFSVLTIRVTNTDGGAVTAGVWPINGTTTKVTRDDFLVSGQGPDGGEALSGTITITRLEPGRTSGTYSASMQFYTLTTGSITGSWDAPVCP